MFLISKNDLKKEQSPHFPRTTEAQVRTLYLEVRSPHSLHRGWIHATCFCAIRYVEDVSTWGGAKKLQGFIAYL